MKKSESINNKTNREENKNTKISLTAPFKDVDKFLKLLIVGQSYMIFILIATIFFEANFSPQVVLLQVVAINIVILIHAIYLILV